MTPKEMTAERFEALADAYGGDVAVWPEAEREAAAQLMAADPARVRDVLARADELDSALAAYSPHRAATGLMDHIVASAPRPLVRRPFGWLVPAGMGAGLAAACAAGMVLGARLSTPPVQDPDSMVTAVSDEDVGAYFDEEA